jgi:alanyl-tRNA synthetase
MKNLTYKELRNRYISFFVRNGHIEIPSASLVPENDPSVLFVNAGMFPLVPFLKGQPHPEGKRLVNSQRCLRTGDIDEVGDATHCTTFEMLGNWSLNDYFKKEAINMTMKFFIEELGFDINKIYATVFQGEKDIPQDEVSITIWKKLFAKYEIEAKVGDNERIMPKGREDNWWGLTTGGPCGPDSEIFVKMEDGSLVEIGNNVFMEYLLEDGRYKPLGIHNVDFGGGLDRLVMISQDKSSVFEIDIYKPILDKVIALSQTEDIKSQRIITDHIKAATWIIMDGVVPGKSEQGYILRRLIRRAVRHGRKLNIQGEFTREIGEICIDQFKEIWPKLEEKREEILSTLEQEEKKFNRTLENGLKELEKAISKEGSISGQKAFQLYETYGLPFEVTEEIVEEKNIETPSKESFQQAQKEHQELSKTSSAGLFKGGLADTSEMSTKYHTASHLLLAALRKIVGEHIYQKGSNITPERLRLDFPNETKLTPEQVEQIEDLINEKISEGLEVTYEEVPKEEALKKVPFAAFEEKYGESVKLYYIGLKENPFSIEICNGPHVSNIGNLGKFKILKQENVGAGIKRIKAILE